MDDHDKIENGPQNCVIRFLRSVGDAANVEESEFSVVLMNACFPITFSYWRLSVYGKTNIKKLTTLLSSLFNSKRFHFKHDFL